MIVQFTGAFRPLFVGIKSCVMCIAVVLLPAAAVIADARPNFAIVMTDDHGYGDVSSYGPSDVRTPHIDRLAAEEMLFTRMRANCTVCSPTRAAILTGRYADRVGVPGIIRGDWKLLQNDPYSPLELYNLKDDPQEQNNLFHSHPKIVRELQAALRLHIQRGGETPWQPPSR